MLWLAFMGHAAAVIAERRLFHDGLAPLPPWPTAVDLFVALVVVLVGDHIGVLLHEAGHAVVSLLVGAGVKALYLGQGRAQLHLHVPVRAGRRLCLSLRAYPGSGATVRRRRVTAGAGAWITAGGPLADLAGLVVAVVAVAPAFRGTQALSLADELLVALALTQTSRLIRNAVPRVDGGAFNDGGKLFLPAGRAVAQDPTPTPFEQWEDTARTSSAGDPGPALGPEVRHTYALLLLAEGRPAEAAQEAMAALRAGDALAPVDRAAVAATVVIGLARSSDRPQARQWLEEVPAWSAWRGAAERSLAD